MREPVGAALNREFRRLERAEKSLTADLTRVTKELDAAKDHLSERIDAADWMIEDRNKEFQRAEKYTATIDAPVMEKMTRLEGLLEAEKCLSAEYREERDKHIAAQVVLVEALKDCRPTNHTKYCSSRRESPAPPCDCVVEQMREKVSRILTNTPDAVTAHQKWVKGLEDALGWYAEPDNYEQHPGVGGNDTSCPWWIEGGGALARNALRPGDLSSVQDDTKNTGATK